MAIKKEKDKEQKNKMETNKPLVFFGWISFGLGSLGLVVPLLPTTPFILLAAFLFSKGSVTAHRWIMENEWSKEIIESWKQGKGIPRKAKIKTLIFTLLSFSFSIYMVGAWYFRVFLITLMIIVITVILRMPTQNDIEDDKKNESN